MTDKPWYRSWPEKVPHHISYPKTSLGNLFTTSASKHPDRTACVFYGAQTSYGELDRLSNRFTRSLVKLGVKKGDRVALYLPNTPQFIIAFYGVIKCGAIITSINLLEKGHEIEYQLKDSGSETIIVLDIFYPIVKKIIEKTNLRRTIITTLRDYLPLSISITGTLLGKIPHQYVEPRSGLYQFKELISNQSADPYPAEIYPEEDIAVIQYTGGTTGTPKGAMLTHMNLISNTIMCLKWLGTESDESYLSVLPFFHIYGLMTGLLAPLYIGARVVMFPKFDPNQVLQAIQNYKIQFFCGVPTLYDKLLRDPNIGKYNYSSLKYCMSGSDPMHTELKERFEKIFGPILTEGYGLSEASPITHSNPLKNTLKGKEGSIGIPWPDTDTKILDLEGNQVKTGEIGELVVNGPQVMKGYWNRSEETAEVLRDGWLYTGDLVKMDKEGYFYLIDRKKDLIKYKGHSVYPHELEEMMYLHPAVRLCSVVGKSDPVAGEIPKAFIVLKEGAKSTSESELMGFVNEKVAHYKAIREIEFRVDLPTNSFGKILKRQLREKSYQIENH